jgi:transposase-like protein
MRTIRKQFNAEAKAKVALDAVRGDRTLSEVAREYRVHPNRVSVWRKLLIGEAARLFEKDSRPQRDEELIEQLYQQIGQLQVKLEWVKKKSGYLD